MRLVAPLDNDSTKGQLMRPKHPALREGNPREAQGDPVPPAPNILPYEAPPTPDTLGEQGAELWRELWDLGEGAYNPISDRFVIERYCQLYERREMLLETLEREGWTDIGTRGQPIQHPAARIVMGVENQMFQIEEKLGLNPESRNRLGILAIEHKSKFDKFLEEDD